MAEENETFESLKLKLKQAEEKKSRINK